MPEEKEPETEEAAERGTITVAERQKESAGTRDAKPTITVAERGSDGSD
jgi:hypothetical protein